jgi:hypothetical protein
MKTPNHLQIMLHLFDSQQKSKQLIVALEDFWREQQMQRPLHLVVHCEIMNETFNFIIEIVNVIFRNEERKQFNVIGYIDAAGGHLKGTVQILEQN